MNNLVKFSRIWTKLSWLVEIGWIELTLVDLIEIIKENWLKWVEISWFQEYQLIRFWNIPSLIIDPLDNQPQVYHDWSEASGLWESLIQSSWISYNMKLLEWGRSPSEEQLELGEMKGDWISLQFPPTQAH